MKLKLKIIILIIVSVLACLFVIVLKLPIQVFVALPDPNPHAVQLAKNHIHGYKDDHLVSHGYNFAKISSLAKSRPLIMSCGPVSEYFQRALINKGVLARQVNMITHKKRNGFDDGHVSIEAFNPKYGKWVFYDIPNNNMFINPKTKIPLSLLEFHMVVDSGDYEIVRLASDNPYDITSNFAEILHTLLGNEKNQRSWYSRIAQEIFIQGYSNLSPKFLKNKYHPPTVLDWLLLKN